MHPHQNRRVGGDVALDQHDMFGALGFIRVDAQGPLAAEFRGNHLLGADLDQIVMAAAIGDEVADRADLQPMFLGKADQIGQTCH